MKKQSYGITKAFIVQAPQHIKTIKISVPTWDTLRHLKKENETFDDVIKLLLRERTVSLGNKNIKVIRYHRKTVFLRTWYKSIHVGLEFEYNDVKNQQDKFTLDLKIKKVFYGKKILNPSTFFGVDNQHKHLSEVYLNLYLRCVAFALEKEFRVTTMMILDDDFEDVAEWRRIYYDYNLSEESFIEDIEEPFRLSEEEHLTGSYKNSIKNSVANSVWTFLK